MASIDRLTGTIPYMDKIVGISYKSERIPIGVKRLRAREYRLIAGKIRLQSTEA